MNELKVFENQEFGEIRTLAFNDELWFVGKDIAESLGYKNTKDAIISHVFEEDRRIIQKSEFTTFENHIPKSVLTMELSISEIPNRGLTIINEAGVYALIFGSKLDSAERFKHWVFKEVLPSIRKTGGYNRPLTMEEQLQIVARGTLEVKEEIKRLDSEFQDFKNDIPLLAIEIDKITEAVKKKGVAVLGGKNSNAYKNSSLRTKLYQDLHRDVRRQFGVSTYKAIKRNQCEQVLAMIENYKPPIFLDDLISSENSQMSIAL